MLNVSNSNKVKLVYLQSLDKRRSSSKVAIVVKLLDVKKISMVIDIPD